MNVVARVYLEKYIKKNRAASGALEAWYHEAISANWQAPIDIKNRYTSASILENDIVVFNIKGNNYRLVVKLYYSRQKVRIKWFGTHASYNAQMKKKKEDRFQDY